MRGEAESDRPTRFKLLLVGVGGQGVLTAARLLGNAALSVGLEGVVGQLHGMSQRGGSVSCTVLFGPGQSSFIEDGAADAVLGLEPLEVLRSRAKMSAATIVVVNRGRLVPHSLAQKGEEYPPVDQVLADIRAVTSDVVEVDGPALVGVVGVPRTLNIVMLGVLAGLRILPLDEPTISAAIEANSPPPYLEANRRAFALGLEEVAA